MKKKIGLALIIILVSIAILVIGWDLFVEIDTTYKGMEFMIPIFCKREVTILSNKDFFDYEKLEKMYLSKRQAKRVLENIEKNSNWREGDIDEKIEERLKFFTREKIYNKIPYIENKYWIFTNRSNGIQDKHSIEEANTMYYAISFGVFDIHNNILYYYEYQR
ncbi:MAG: hypothetical protein Q4C11_02240 [Clostridium sp.]|nr:hypothetical protein [Clostridium sp.]